MAAIPVVINLEAMFPGLEHQPMCYIFHVCGLRDIPSQTWLMQYEGLRTVEELANYTDSELESMTDRNSKRSPAATRVLIGLARTNKLKAVKFWVNKKLREDAPCDLMELTDAKIAQLICKMSLFKDGTKESDSKLYYPEAFNADDYKNWIKKVTNYLDWRKGQAGVPLSYVSICPANANPNAVPDEYTRTLWAALFETPQFIEDNHEVYHLFKVLLTKTDGATWFER